MENNYSEKDNKCKVYNKHVGVYVGVNYDYSCFLYKIHFKEQRVTGFFYSFFLMPLSCSLS